MEATEKKKINKGVISEKKLIHLFATPKQRNSYYANGEKFTGTSKDRVLKEAERLCEIKPLGNRQYQITKVYKYPAPRNFNKMNEGLHKYLTPLILINLIAMRIHEKENLVFSCRRWYKMIDLINDNYTNMSGNIKYSSKKTSVPMDILGDYFDSTDNQLLYYFKKSLEYLKASDLFDYQQIKWICIRKTEKDNNDNKRKVDIRYEHQRATQEELEFIRKCDQEACLLSDIRTDDFQEKYYGKKSQQYFHHYNMALARRDIVCCYSVYEIVATDRDIRRCYKLLEMFDITDKSELVNLLGSTFQDNLVSNADKRIHKGIEDNSRKYGSLSKEQAEDFINNYAKIASLTIGLVEEDQIITGFPKAIDNKEIAYINNIIEDNIDITLNGSKINIGVGMDIS